MVGKGRGERTEDLDIVVGREMAAFELVAFEAVLGLQRLSRGDDLVGHGFAASAGFIIAVAVEEV